MGIDLNKEKTKNSIQKLWVHTISVIPNSKKAKEALIIEKQPIHG